VVAPKSLDVLQHALEECIGSSRQTSTTVKHVKRYLDQLRDGFSDLAVFQSELTSDTIDSLKQFVRIKTYIIPQLQETQALDSALASAAERIEDQLRREKPWRDIQAFATDQADLIAAYAQKRTAILNSQQAEIEDRRSAVKIREGFSTLTNDQAHSVLKSFAAAPIETSFDAIAPTLKHLEDLFPARLTRAWEEANERLDSILSAGNRPTVRKLDLSLRNREIVTKEDVESLVSEIRTRLLEQVEQGLRVRLV
jgi:hypothetical protein